ncbi:MAG: cupin domain-containing protein [Opitutae bacterium]|nr:cupin domain-containing protein [Opitutae bacterium]
MNHRGLSPDHLTAGDVVRLLRLEPLDQEGGYFRRTGGSSTILPGGKRAWSTIHSLITPEGFSALHRLATDEIWCFHAGDPLESLRLRPDGTGEWVKLGLNLAHGERPQDVVPAATWQGTRLAAGGRWALVTCVVAPEFVWGDFELGSRETLVASHAAFAAGIRALTRVVPPAGKL